MKNFVLLFSLVCICLVFPLNSYAVTVYIGDADGFGFTNLENYQAPNDYQSNEVPTVDLNSNGILDMGDVLPDLNNDGTVKATGGDNFDNRSDEEKNDSFAMWTDVSLSKTFIDNIPGLAGDVSFEFYFTIDPNDPYYEKDHYISFLYGDYEVGEMKAIVEGKEVALLGNRDAGLNGYIWAAYAPVSWSDMLDGKVTIDIIAPGKDDKGEPYTAFDYAVLDANPVGGNPTPEPATMILLSSGLIGLAGIGRRKLGKS